MDIPQEVIDDLILTLHQSQHHSILLGGTSGQPSADISLHASRIRHRHQKQAISAAISTMMEFASPHVQRKLGKRYQEKV